MRPRDGTMNSIRTQPVPWFVIWTILPLRLASSWVIAPRCSSGVSMVSSSKGSCSLPSTCLVTTCGLPTVSSKPSRRICSTRMASASSPRPWTSHASGRPMSSTRSDTLPISSESRRDLTMRAVSLWPLTRPTSGEVLVPMTTEMAGSSTVIVGRATGFSMSARVSPIMISGIPATATMSPATATSPGSRLTPTVFSSSVILTFLTPSACIHATFCPLRSSPLWMRTSARRPRKSEASRLVTWACSGAAESPLGAGTCSMRTSNSTSRFSVSGACPSSGRFIDALPSRPDAYRTGRSSSASAAAAASSSRSDARSRSRSWASVTTSSMRASGRSVLFTTMMTGSDAASALRSTKRVCGSGPSDASTSSTTPSTIDRPRSTSPPKSAWPGVSMTLMTVTVPSGLWRWTAVFFARMVMPFSRSRSPESMTRSTSSARSAKAPDWRSMASTRVVLPWSTCATMATLRKLVVLTRGVLLAADGATRSCCRTASGCRYAHA